MQIRSFQENYQQQGGEVGTKANERTNNGDWL